jgi:poly(3-hydroxybutyrate) depolymerase
MDLTAEFFLQTIDTAFVKQALPKGEVEHAIPVNLAAIRRVRMPLVEGENDDISGTGQTLAGQDLCQTLPRSMKANYLQENVGHYGEQFTFPLTRSCRGFVPLLDKPSRPRPEAGGNGGDASNKKKTRRAVLCLSYDQQRFS